MKDVAVYPGYTEVLERAGDRLAHLRREIAIRVVWQAVILAALISKLCLKKKIFSRNDTRGDCRSDCGADVFFDVVLALICSVESAKTGSDRLQYQWFCTILLPSCTIHDARQSQASEIRSPGVLHQASLHGSGLSHAGSPEIALPIARQVI